MSTTMAQQVWIYFDEGDHHHGRSLATQIMHVLRDAGCPGASMLRGVGGFGVHGMIHSDLVLDIPGRLPLIITFIDHADRVASVLPTLRELVPEGLIAIHPIEVIQHSHRNTGPFPRHLSVADVMSRNVSSVNAETPVATIVSLLIDRALRCLPVVDAEQHVLGMITDGDLLRRGITTLPLRLQQLLPLSECVDRLAALNTQAQRATELMTTNPICLLASTPLAQAAAEMADHGLKRLPVVDQEGHLVGIVSRSDLLKTLAEGLRQRPEQLLQNSADDTATISALMITNVPVVQANTDLAETLDRLMESEKRRVIVVDEHQRVIGIITDGDVLRRAGQRDHGGAFQRLMDWFGGGKRPEGLELVTQGRTAASIMTSPVITITPETSIAEAIRLMMAHSIKRLPVVDQQGKLLGMLGRAAALRALQHVH